MRPMPAAWAYGTLANRPMTRVPMMAAMMVARNTPPHGIPVCDRICGLTTMM